MSVLPLSFGNRKLPKTTAIFNMGTAGRCPSDRLGLCEVSEKCYAKKPERLYPQVIPYRERQRDYWLSCTADQFVSDFLEAISRKRIKIVTLRINEAGDFYSQACVDKLQAIAAKLKESGVVTYVYTARRDLDYSNTVDLVVNGSGFVKSGIDNSFTAVKGTMIVEGSAVICGEDCKVCDLCSIAGNRKIFVRQH